MGYVILSLSTWAQLYSDTYKVKSKGLGNGATYYMTYRMFLKTLSSTHFFTSYKYYCIFTNVFSPYFFYIFNFLLDYTYTIICYFQKKQYGKKLDKVVSIWRKFYILSKSKHGQLTNYDT